MSAIEKDETLEALLAELKLFSLVPTTPIQRNSIDLLNAGIRAHVGALNIMVKTLERRCEDLEEQIDNLQDSES